MCYVGFIINDSHPCLKTISGVEIEKYQGDKPILIVGLEKALELYPHIALSSKVIDSKKKLYYSLSKEESVDKYEETLNNFITNCFDSLIKKFKVVNIQKLEDIKVIFGRVFVYETSTTITITTSNTIYYINKEIVAFFNKEIITTEKVYKFLEGCEIISWDNYKFFGAYLKANNCYKSKEQVEVLFSYFGNIALYMGAVCLKTISDLKLNDDLIALWQNAFKVDSMLSQIKIKVNNNIISALANTNDNVIMQNIYEAIDDNYIVQKYNGVDKTTGRIYPFGTGFSLQSLPKLSRKIIIAEPNCVLVEFDYQAFEYNILAQLCKFHIPGDPHLYISQLLFKDNEHRAIGKALNYSLLYGKSVPHIISETLKQPGLKISKEELSQKLKEILAPVEELQKRLEKQLKETGGLENYFGRNIYPEKNYACLNNYIQSTAAEILIIKLLKLEELLRKYDPINKIVLQSHDSILINLSLKTIEETEIAAEIKNLLEQEEKGLVNKVSIKHGADWGNIT